MILKAACSNNLCFIDRLITSFMRVLQRMAKEHLNPSAQESNPGIKHYCDKCFMGDTCICKASIFRNSLVSINIIC